jgi:hypothetical protein
MLRRDNFNEVLEMLNEAEKNQPEVREKSYKFKKKFIVRI